MAIVAFWSNEEKETGQTMSMVALSTYMSIEHNYRILNVSTSFRENVLENCYWDLDKANDLLKTLSGNNAGQLALESGVEGLAKIINSNKTSNNIVSSYTKVVFKEHLDVLCSTQVKSYEEYERIAQLYPNILQVANRDYDLIFVDISKKMPEEYRNQILEIADVIVMNITQRLTTINSLIKLKEENDFFKKNNILVNIGRYDKFSKYNVKNITRYMREKKDVHAIPYNTLFFEACSEGKTAEFFLRLRRLEPDDRNAVFVEETARLSKDLIYKLQELQVKL